MKVAVAGVGALGGMKPWGNGMSPSGVGPCACAERAGVGCGRGVGLGVGIGVGRDFTPGGCGGIPPPPVATDGCGWWCGCGWCGGCCECIAAAAAAL